jgi:hypothetical protein
MADETLNLSKPAPPQKPEFVDNRELSLADALRAHMDWLAATHIAPQELDIATGYFNPEGFSLLAERLKRLKGVRLLLGAEPSPPPMRPMRMPGDPLGAGFEAKLVRDALSSQTEGLERDRNLLEFNAPTEGAVRKLLEFLESGRMEVRRYEKGFLHGKAFLFSTDDEGVISGSSNFTAAGLTRNLELNMGRYDPTPVAKVRGWFDSLWEEAVPYDLAEVYRARYELYPPYLIYLRVLWERYKDELEEEKEETLQARIRLTGFQEDGVWRARRILEQYNGVLIADGVGLGKSFIGGELLRSVVEDHRQRALLIAPAALRDGTWERFRHRHQLYMECISYEQLANEKQLGMGEGAYLEQHPNEYSLVVVDEAQAFRNPASFRARALRALLMGTPPKKLVLMSATPVNNSLWDLYYLLSYFIRNDAAFADLGIRSIKERFLYAMGMNPDDLSPDVLFDLLDATTVRRTRHFVQRYYPNDTVEGPGGQLIPIRFPDPHVLKVNYSLDGVLPGFLDQFEQDLAPEQGEPRLTLARYMPSKFRTDSGGEADFTELILVGLLCSGLLKRLESSAVAFARTSQKMADACAAFIAGLDRGFVLKAEEIEELQQTDNDEALDEFLKESGAEPVAGYDVDAMRAAVEADQKLLSAYAERARTVTRERDPKLLALLPELAEILRQANDEGLDQQDKRDRRKVVIFSYFADTAKWIADHLSDVLAEDRRLAEYRGRMTCVRGDEGYEGVGREHAVYGFAPTSSEAPPGSDEDRFDILVTTDVLAEGVNLQQARHIINYDLPWNPMRLVQRHGRVDRIGSPHRDVYLRCFFPDQRLEDLLELERRIRAKLTTAAHTVGVESAVIPGAEAFEVVFADEREEIERLRQGDPTIFVSGGQKQNAYSGEEYRQELRKGLEKYADEIRKLPWGSGSSMLGEQDGHFFCARIGDRLFLRFLPKGAVEPKRDNLECLRLIACPEDSAAQPADLNDAYSAWETARADIFNDWTRDTDPANIQPRVSRGLRDAAEHLRRFPPANFEQSEIERAINSIEAPMPNREERALKEIFARNREKNPRQASMELVAEIKRLGLEPFTPPAPLDPIEPEDVRLICWMAVRSRLGV